MVYLPTWSQLRIAAQQRLPVGSGGDFFEVVQGRDGRVSMVMADVSGNGPIAAASVSSLRWVIRQELTRGQGPGTVLERLNDWMVGEGSQERFATALCVRIDPQLGLVEIASAGHVAPFIKRAAGGAVEMAMSTGIGLGILAGESYEVTVVTLEPEDLMVMVTDGISDRFATAEDPLGTAALRRRLADVRHGLQPVCAAMLGGSAEVTRDETVLVVEVPRRHRRITPIANAR
jgi:two-component system, chemotaxis family, sensor kinase Cph1